MRTTWLPSFSASKIRTTRIISDSNGWGAREPSRRAPAISGRDGLRRRNLACHPLRLAGAAPLSLAKRVPPPGGFIASHDVLPQAVSSRVGAAKLPPGRSDQSRRIAFAIATHERRLRSDKAVGPRNAVKKQPHAGQAARLAGVLEQARCQLCTVRRSSPTVTSISSVPRAELGLGRKPSTPSVRRAPAHAPLRSRLRERTGLCTTALALARRSPRLIDLYVSRPARQRSGDGDAIDPHLAAPSEPEREGRPARLSPAWAGRSAGRGSDYAVRPGAPGDRVGAPRITRAARRRVSAHCLPPFAPDGVTSDNGYVSMRG